MTVDHCICPNCAILWEFDEPEETGVVTHCNHCARNFKVGRWCGKHYPNLFASLFRSPICPQCSGTNSTRGQQVGFYSVNLYLRQCKDCCAVWIARK